MQKKLLVALAASLMVSGGMFGAGAERAESKKAKEQEKNTVIRWEVQSNVLSEAPSFDLIRALGHARDPYALADSPYDADDNGLTIFMIAAKKNKEPRTLKVLIQEYGEFKDIDLNFQDTKGRTALYYVFQNQKASDKTKIEMAKYLMKKGANPSIMADKTIQPRSALDAIKQLATQKKEYQELLDWMLQKGYAAKEQASGGPKIAE